MMRACGLLLLAIGCAQDPCSGDSGTCLVLDVTSQVEPLDELGVALTGAVQFARQAPLSSLPVLVALHLPDVSGALHIDGTGYRGGVALASAALDVQLMPGEHLRRALKLGAGSGDDLANPDLVTGADLAPASPDLASPDLAPSADLAPPRDLEPPPDLLIPAVASCADGVANQDESDVDCGGSCAAKCVAGQKCGGNSDCGTGSCQASRCVLALCVGGASFADKHDYSAINGTNDFAFGDLNGDGYIDIVADNYDGDGLSVLLNNGDGTFADHKDYLTGAGTHPGVSIGDLDGDGILDVVAPVTGDEVLTFIGNGDGTLTQGDSVQFADQTGTVAIIDLNGDGVNDLVAANGQQAVGTDPNQLYVRLGLGSNTYGNRAGYGVSGDSGRMVVADVSGDGKPDLIVNDTFTNDVGVLLNAGAGTFGMVHNYGVDTEPAGLAVADVSGDGKPDLVVSTFVSNTVGVLVNQGGGAFAGNQDLSNGSPGTAVNGLVATDFNGDALPDIAFTAINANALRVLVNQGGGGTSFTTDHDYTTGGQPYSVHAADVNGDGLTDLVTADNVGSVSVFLHTGPSPFASPSPIPAGAPTSWVAAGDLDGDGKPDLVASTGFVTVMLNQGGGSFGPLANFMAGPSPAGVALVDLDGDGKLDVAAANSGNGTVSVLLNDGGGALHAARSFSTGAGASAVVAGDFNGDGWPDLAVANPDDNSVSVLINLGRWHAGGGLAPATRIPISGAPSSLAVADFDGNGRADLAVAARGGIISVLSSLGDGTFASPVPYAGGTAPSGLTAGDFDGDHKPDLAVANAAGIGILFNVGDGSFFKRIDHGLAEAPTMVVTADFDGDGRPDVGAAGPTRVSVLRSLGLKAFADPAYYLMDPGTSSVAAADFSGDGRIDLVSSNSNDSQLRLRFGQCW
jgi:hypothetical protein